MPYASTFLELQKNAIKWWPSDLLEQVAAASPIPLLIKTQEEFISILKLSGRSSGQIFDVLDASGMAANMFVKHLAIMADFGGEPLKKLGSDFQIVFPANATGKHTLNFVFQEKPTIYTFEALPIKNLSNQKLCLDGKSLAKPQPMSPLYRDVIMILLHGATSDASDLAGLHKCTIGPNLGNAELLEKYVRERYLYVSKITSGEDTNKLGQIAQSHVCKILRNSLPMVYEVRSSGTIPLAGYGKASGVPFDIVISHNEKRVGVEVSFQVTTNSTIERKAGLAEERQAAMHAAGHYVAYVLDGAGNFERSSALGTLCKFSDCTVAYSDQQIQYLASFIREKLDD